MLRFAALLLVQPIQQQQCTAMDANLPAPLAAWTTPGYGRPTDLTRPLTLVAMDAKSVTGLPAGAKPGSAVATRFSVDKPGVYGIATDKAAWIDVVPEGAAVPLTSVKHGHGPECSTIRKIVRFDLKTGNYTLYLSEIPAGGDAKIKVMLVAPE